MLCLSSSEGVTPQAIIPLTSLDHGMNLFVGRDIRSQWKSNNNPWILSFSSAAAFASSLLWASTSLFGSSVFLCFWQAIISIVGKVKASILSTSLSTSTMREITSLKWISTMHFGSKGSLITCPLTCASRIRSFTHFLFGTNFFALDYRILGSQMSLWRITIDRLQNISKTAPYLYGPGNPPKVSCRDITSISLSWCWVQVCKPPLWLR